MTKVRVAFNESEMRRKMSVLLETIGFKIENRAKTICVREAFDTGELANSISHEVDLGRSAVIVGSNAPHALYNEFGTGFRGAAAYRQYFDEEKPEFTIPIVIEPKTKKALHWVGKDGKHHFAKRVESLGRKPVAFLRRSLFEGQGDIKESVKEVFK